jgi:hypothetical protein
MLTLHLDCSRMEPRHIPFQFIYISSLCFHSVQWQKQRLSFFLVLVWVVGGGGEGGGGHCQLKNSTVVILFLHNHTWDTLENHTILALGVFGYCFPISTFTYTNRPDLVWERFVHPILLVNFTYCHIGCFLVHILIYVGLFVKNLVISL